MFDVHKRYNYIIHSYLDIYKKIVNKIVNNYQKFIPTYIYNNIMNITLNDSATIIMDEIVKLFETSIEYNIFTYKEIDLIHK